MDQSSCFLRWVCGRPVTDWLTTVELHLLPDDLVRQALVHISSLEHTGRSAVQGGSALPFAARYAIAESSALRKRRDKMNLELRTACVKNQREKSLFAPSS
eukprot:5061310-Amphidinium_carterae.1